jgi:hypothetical protein
MTLFNSTAFATWYDKYTKLNPAFECSENDNMESILQFFIKPTDDPLQCHPLLQTRSSRWH